MGGIQFFPVFLTKILNPATIGFLPKLHPVKSDLLSFYVTVNLKDWRRLARNPMLIRRLLILKAKIEVKIWASVFYSPYEKDKQTEAG